MSIDMQFYDREAAAAEEAVGVIKSAMIRIRAIRDLNDDVERDLIAALTDLASDAEFYAKQAEERLAVAQPDWIADERRAYRAAVL